MKEYFSHDYNARNDRKLVKLQMSLGMEAIGCYWCIVEMLYEEGGYMRSECDRIAFELRVEKNVIRQIIEDFELFRFDAEKFWSESVLARLNARNEKSAKASKSAKSRWGKSECNANAMRTQCVRNAIKLNKSKEKKSKLNKNKIQNTDNTSALFNELKTAFCNFYKSTTSQEFYFGPAEAGALGQLILKIKNSITAKDNEPTDQAVTDGFTYILNHLPKWQIDHLSIKNINGQYNSIIACIQSGRAATNSGLKERILASMVAGGGSQEG